MKRGKYSEANLCIHWELKLTLHIYFHWVVQLLRLNSRNKVCGQIQVILLGDYYVQFHSLPGCPSEPWCWGSSFYGCFAPFPDRARTFAALAEHQGTGRCRRGDPARCWGWSNRSTGDRWGKWSAQIHTARQSAARTQTCIRPRGGRAQTQLWNWQWWQPGCPRFCGAHGRRGKGIVVVSPRCGRMCSWGRKHKCR